MDLTDPNLGARVSVAGLRRGVSDRAIMMIFVLPEGEESDDG